MIFIVTCQVENTPISIGRNFRDEILFIFNFRDEIKFIFMAYVKDTISLLSFYFSVKKTNMTNQIK